MNEDFESEDEEDFEDVKANRQKRMANRKKHSRSANREQKIKPVNNTRKRVNTIQWNPDYDEDDYEEYYYD